MRRTDESGYWRSVRLLKGVLGVLSLVLAVIVYVTPQEGLGHNHFVHAAISVGFILFAGMMIDVEGTTRLARLVIDALPWTPNPPLPPPDPDEED
jgi:hypothetical protein